MVDEEEEEVEVGDSSGDIGQGMCGGEGPGNLMMEMKVMKVMMVHLAIILMMEKRVMVTAREAVEEDAVEVDSEEGLDSEDVVSGEDLEGRGDSEVVMMEERAKPKEVPDLIKNTITLSSVTTLYTYFMFSDKPSQHLILSLGVIVCSTTS